MRFGRGVKPADVYASGYALPFYDVRAGVRYWRYRDEEYTLAWNAVNLTHLPGYRYQVGRIEDVRAAHG